MAQLTNEERIEVNDGREMKVLMIVGSLRKNSFNKQLAAMAEQELGDRASVSVLDWSEVPVFNQDRGIPHAQVGRRGARCGERGGCDLDFHARVQP